MRRDLLLIEEMIDAAERAMELIGRATADEVAANRERCDAVLWNFTVLGEAATHVTEPTRSLAPHLSWRDPIRLRNRIVHAYWSVDIDVIVSAAQDDLPSLVAELRAIATLLS